MGTHCDGSETKLHHSKPETKTVSEVVSGKFSVEKGSMLHLQQVTSWWPFLEHGGTYSGGWDGMDEF